MKNKLTIVIATSSLDKIEGIREAFKSYFTEEIEIKYGKSESGVPEQPFGNETYQGACNRIDYIRDKVDTLLKSQGLCADYYVSCEAGIDNTNRVNIKGIENPIYTSKQIVCIYDPRSDSYHFGESSSWTIPAEDIEEIINTDLDKYLRNRRCKGLNDVGDGRYISRQEAIEQATESAIASMKFRKRGRDTMDRENSTSLENS